MGWTYKQPFILGLILLVSACSQPKPQTYSQTRVLMGTIVDIKVIEKDKQRAKIAIDQAFKRIKELDEQMSWTNPKSEVFRFNQKATEKMKVSQDLAYLLDMAVKYSRLTDGAFDVTIGPLTKLWGFDKGVKRKTPPPKEEIAASAALVNYNELKIDLTKMEAGLLKKGMIIDLGGLAKGYAVDEAIRGLKEAGISQGLVNLGGNIKVIGQNSSLSNWQIGVIHPRKRNEILAVLPLKDIAVATSGDYEHFFFYQGRRYHHLLNTKSGYPANSCISVTIITSSALVADILSTSVFIMGEIAGLKLVEELEGVEAIIVTDSQIKLSSGLQGKISIGRL